MLSMAMLMVMNMPLDMDMDMLTMDILDTRMPTMDTMDIIIKLLFYFVEN